MSFAEKLLIELPKFVNIPLLCDWLEMVDLGRFDSAECNKLTRSHLTDIMSSNLSVFTGCALSNFQFQSSVKSDNNTKAQASYLKWMNTRSLSVKNIELNMFDGADYTDIFSIVIQEKQCSKADSLLLKCDSYNRSITLTLLLRLTVLFPRLKVLTLTNVQLHNNHNWNVLLQFPILQEVTMNNSNVTIDIPLQILNNCQSITKFSFADSSIRIPYSASQESTTIDTLLEKLSLIGSNLTYLNLSGCDVSDITLLTDLIAKCPLLEECNLTNFEGVDDSVVECLLTHCPNYKHFQMDSSYELTDAGVTSIAMKCPQLITLNVDECDNSVLTDVSLRLITQHCRSLEVFNVTEGTASSETVCSVLANCKQIREINAQILTSIEGDESALLSVVRSGPCLQLVSITIDSTDDDRVKEEVLFLSIAAVAPNLINLSLSGSSICDNAFSCIMRNCLLLTTLDASNCENLTTASMTALNKNQKLLVTLAIQYTKMASTASIKNLVKNNPNLKQVSWTYHTKSSPDAAMEELELQRPELTINYGGVNQHSYRHHSFLPSVFGY
jgi:uncharacterized protein YjbI with pentapeptide repeats